MIIIPVRLGKALTTCSEVVEQHRVAKHVFDLHIIADRARREGASIDVCERAQSNFTDALRTLSAVERIKLERLSR